MPTGRSGRFASHAARPSAGIDTSPGGDSYEVDLFSTLQFEESPRYPPQRAQ